MGVGQRPEKRFYTKEYVKQCEEELAQRKLDIVKLKASMKCSHCDGTGIKDPGDFRTEQMRQWCKDFGVDIPPDDTVDRSMAARILDRSTYTLRNWALTDSGPKFRKCPNGRYRYKLEDLTKWLWANQDRIKFWQ